MSQVFSYDDFAAPESESLSVIVYSGQTRSIGLVVDQIVDIVEEAVTNQYGAQREGLLGTAIIQQRVTELLDVPGIIRTCAPDWVGCANPAGAAADKQWWAGRTPAHANGNPLLESTLPVGG